MLNGREKAKHYKDCLSGRKGCRSRKASMDLLRDSRRTNDLALCSQMRRAAVSVPSNIAEGQARHGTREFLQFLSHASGSLAELETQLLLSVGHEVLCGEMMWKA